jgi:hypothetical protein
VRSMEFGGVFIKHHRVQHSLPPQYKSCGTRIPGDERISFARRARNTASRILSHILCLRAYPC